MIADVKNVSASRLSGLMSYVYREDKDPEIVDSACFDPSHKQAQREIMDAMCMRREIKKPLMHAIISVDAFERMEDDQWQEVVQTYMDKMGFEMCPYVAVRHHDTDHDHIHIIASRVSDVDRSLVSDSFDYYRAQSVLREIEKQHDLKRVPSSWEKGKDYVKPMSQARLHKDKREGKTEVYKTLITRVQEVQERAKDMPDFKRKLAAHGIDLVPKVARHKAHIQGVYFEHEGVKVAGSKLNRAYSWGNLQKQLPYDAERDFEVMTRPPTPEQLSTSSVASEGVIGAGRLPSQTVVPEPVLEMPEKAYALPIKKKPGDVDKGCMKKALERAQYGRGWHGFVTSMRAQGVDVVPKVAQSNTQKMTGVYLEFGEVLYPASGVDRQASFGNLQKRIGVFDAQEYQGEFKRVLVPGVGIQSPAWTPNEPARVLEVTRAPEPVKSPRPIQHQPRQNTPERIAPKQPAPVPEHRPKPVQDVPKKPAVFHPRTLAMTHGVVMDVNQLAQSCKAHDIALTVASKKNAQLPAHVCPRCVEYKQQTMRIVITKDAGYVLVPESKALSKRVGQTVLIDDAIKAHEREQKLARPVVEERVVDKSAKQSVLERDLYKPVREDAFLAHLSNDRRPVRLQDKNQQLLSVQQWAKAVEKQGRIIQHVDDAKPGKRTVMEAVVHTKDGPMTALVNRRHAVVLVPYDKSHDVLRGRDIELVRDKDRKPVLEPIARPQPRQHMPQEMSPEKPLRLDPTKPERERLKPLPKGELLSQLKAPKTFAVLDAQKRPMDLEQLIQTQKDKGQIWQKIDDAKLGQRTVMEGIIQTRQGPMTALVNRYHGVALVPYDKAHDAVRGQDVELVRDDQRRTHLKTADNQLIKAQVKIVEHDRRPSLDLYIEKMQQAGKQVKTLGAGRSTKGKLLAQKIDTKEGIFRMIERANKEIVIVPDHKDLEHKVNQRVRVERTRHNEIKIGPSQDKMWSRDDR